MDMVHAFGELPSEIDPFAGGKGGTLAWLFRAGYPVPEGFVILLGDPGMVVKPRVRRRWVMDSARKLKPRIPNFIDEMPALAKKLHVEIRAAQTSDDLISLWREALEAHLGDSLQVLLAGLSECRSLSRKLHIKFENLVGDAHANVLLERRDGNPSGHVACLFVSSVL